jgi:hypothetical protein
MTVHAFDFEPEDKDVHEPPISLEDAGTLKPPHA